MPYYDFLCKKCGHQFEEFFSVSDDRSSLKCPECGSKKVERNFGSISFGVAKGSGKTDSCGGSCSSCSTGCDH